MNGSPDISDEERDRLELVFETIPDPLVLHNAEGRIIEANPQVIEHLGYSQAELRSIRIGDIETEHDSEDLITLWAGLKAGERTTVEGRHQRADGSIVPVEISIRRVDIDGKPHFLTISRDISERMEREQQLRLFERAVDRTAHAVFITDPNGIVVYVNPAFERITGYSAAEITGQRTSLLQSCEEGEAHDGDHWESILTGEQWQGEIIDERKNGERIILEQTISPLTDDEGEVENVVVVAQDVTERTDRERKLERYRRFVERSSAIVTALDSEGRVTFQSAAIERVLGYDPDELLGDVVFEYLHPDDVEETVATFESAIEDGEETFTDSFRFRAADGSWRWLQATGRSHLDDPAIEGVIVSSVDVTERRRQAAHLEKAQAVGSMGSWQLDMTEDELHWSAEVYEIFGIDPDTPMTYERFLEHVHPDDRARLEAEWRGALEGEPYDIEHRIRAINGEVRWVRERAEVEFDESGEPISGIGIVQDITDQKEREQQLRRFEAFIENSPTMVTLLDTDGTVLLDKSGVDVEWRHPPETFLDTNVLEYIHQADRERVTAAFESLTANPGEPMAIEYRFRGTDGEWRWLRTSAVNHEQDPLIGGIIAISIDVTVRKRRERELEQYESLVESAGDVLWMFDADFSEALVINDAYEEHFGQPTDALDQEATAFLEAIHPDDRGRMRRGMKRLQEGERIDLELRVNPGEDFDRWLWIKGAPILREDDPIAFAGFARDVTKRRERERALQRHRTYLESANDIITLIDPDGTIRFISSAVKRVLGYEPEELIGENGFTFLHPEDREDRLEQLERLVAEPESSAVFKFRFRCADGSFCWIEATARNLLADDDVGGILLSSRDITERVQHERRLSALHGATRRLIDADSPETVADIAVEAASELLDFSLPSVWFPDDDEFELVANSDEHQLMLEDAGTPQPVHSADSWLWDVLESGETVTRIPLPAEDLAAAVPIQSAIILPIGEHGILACAARGAVPFSDRQVRVAEILARNVQVVLDQLAHRAAIRRQKQFTDDLLDAIEDVVYVLDEDGDLRDWNRALEAVTGYDHTEIDSMNAADFFADDDRVAVATAVREAFETGRTRVQLEFETVDGRQIPFEFVANSFTDPDGNSVMAGIGRDRTRHVEYERTLERQRDNLQVLNQVVRHDIRNDLTVIHGRAGMLAEYVDEPAEDDLQSLIDATDRAIELTRTARDLAESMLQTGTDVETVRLGPHLEAPIETARERFEDALIVVADRIPDVAVRGNSFLEAVFRNLIQNAVIHNDSEIPRVNIKTKVKAETVTVRVGDNGPGIPDDRKEEIFGKGERGLDSPGTGIGLYLVRTVVDRCGGDVWVEDNEPTGAVFVVELPLGEE